MFAAKPPFVVLAAFLCGACARTDIYYPTSAYDGKSGAPIPTRAVVLNGSDALGHTEVEVTSGGVRLLAAGGIDNSTSTKEGYRTVRHGVTTAATAAVLGIGISEAASAYSANQAASSASSVAASKSASDIAATKGATAVELSRIQAASAIRAAEAAKALPAAGSTINSVVPAVVTPLP